MIRIARISFPHSVKDFFVSSDNDKLLHLLEVYYGSLYLLEREVICDTFCDTICYIDGFFYLKNGIKCSKMQIQSCEVAFCNIVMYIRNNIQMLDDWFIYHGSCSVIGNKTYLFIGSTMSGKTTLSAYLDCQQFSKTVSEDISVVNIKAQEIVSIKRSFFLRPASVELLTTSYGMNISTNGTCTYNINEKIIASPNSIIPNKLYKIDEILFLNLNKGYAKKQRCEDIKDLIVNSYNLNDINKNVYSSTTLGKYIPMYKLYYYDLREVYFKLLG